MSEDSLQARLDAQNKENVRWAIKRLAIGMLALTAFFSAWGYLLVKILS